MMFLQVYFHDIRRIYDKHLTDFIKAMLIEEGREGVYPIELNDYFKYDDNYVTQNIKTYTLQDGKRDISALAKILSFRKHFRPIKSIFLTSKKDDLPKRKNNFKFQGA